MTVRTSRPFSRFGRGLSIALLLLCITRSTHAQNAKADSLAWYQSITVNGLVSASTTVNFNHPSDNLNRLRVFDIDANSINLDLLSLTVHHEPAVGEAGFRADISVGPNIPRLIHSAGMANGDWDLTQAYASYVAEIGAGLRFDMGKFIAPLGYEYIDRFDGLNDNASHSFLFGYAVPFTTTGVRVTYPFSDVFSVCGMVANGWDNSVDNNTAKTYCLLLSLLPSSTSSFILTAIRGAEKPGNATDMRSVLDLVASFKIGERITVGVNGDYGMEQNDQRSSLFADTSHGDLVINSYGDATWDGIAGYIRYTISDKFAFILRAEVFDDPQGVRTGTPQTLHGYTLTPEWKPTAHFVLRGDLRNDRSTAYVFDHDGARWGSQLTASINALYSF